MGEIQKNKQTEDVSDEVKDKDYNRIWHEHSGTTAFIFSNFIWIKPYEVCTADKEFFGGSI